MMSNEFVDHDDQGQVSNSSLTSSLSETTPEKTSRLSLLRASAGAGKTYQLTSRYIALLVAGAEPASILATTFTRKAAGEILGRVLLRVAQAAVDAGECQKLNQAIFEQEIGTVKRFNCSDYQRLLSRLVRHLDQLAISTIDGFFSRWVTAFSLELGVPTQPQLTDDGSALARDLRGQAIDQLLEQAATDDFQTLIALLRQIHFDDARQSVAGSLDRLLSGGVDGLYDVYRQAPLNEQWPALVCPKPLGQDQLTADIQALADAYELLPRTGKGAVNKTWLKGWQRGLLDLQAKRWDSFLKNGPAVKAVERKGFSRVKADEPLCMLYEPLVTHAIASLITQLNQQTRSTYQLLSRFSHGFQSVCRDQQVLFYADLTDLLVRKLPKLETQVVQELAFRLDSQVQHLLIDEFQDTAIDQYRVLWPLIEEAGIDETSDRSFFCVGDAKQSIYGWRGGRVELFDQIKQALDPYGLKTQSVATSWRSSQIVLNAVNQVFSNLEHAEAWAKDDVAKKRFADLFELHQAQNDLPGYICLKTTVHEPQALDEFSVDDEDAGFRAHDLQVAQEVWDFHQQAPKATVALLTRSNAQASSLLAALRAKGVPASGEGGAVLTDHPAVTAILAAFTLADHPGDQVAAFHVLSSPLASWLGMKDAQSDQAIGASTILRRLVLDHGVPGLVAKLVEVLRPGLEHSQDQTGLRRLSQLVTFAQTQQIPSLLRPSRLVQAVEAARVPDPEAAAVTVMTIHKSKGLEFDAVFLPTLAARPTRFSPLCVEKREGDTGPIQAVYRAGDQAVRDVCEPLNDLYEQAKQRSRFEDLCTLYVAMTRAKHGLYLLAPPPTGKNGQYGNGTYAQLLAEQLVDEDVFSSVAEDQPDQPRPLNPCVLYEEGDSTWFNQLNFGEQKHAEANQAGLGNQPDKTHEPLTWAYQRGKGRLPRAISPSAPDRARVMDAVSLLNRAEDWGVGFDLASSGELKSEIPWGSETMLGATSATMSGAIFGQMVHDVFEQVGFIDDPDFAWHDIWRQMTDMPDQVKDTIDQAIEVPEIATLLSRRDALGIKHEYGFAYRQSDGIVRGQIDRLVWWEDAQGLVTHAQVIDFKTDRALPGGASELVERYVDQMLAYRKAVAGLYDLDLAKVSATLVWVTQGQCVDIG